jgi:hypothetical protein
MSRLQADRNDDWRRRTIEGHPLPRETDSSVVTTESLHDQE